MFIWEEILLTDTCGRCFESTPAFYCSTVRTCVRLVQLVLVLNGLYNRTHQQIAGNKTGVATTCLRQSTTQPRQEKPKQNAGMANKTATDSRHDTPACHLALSVLSFIPETKKTTLSHPVVGAHDRLDLDVGALGGFVLDWPVLVGRTVPVPAVVFMLQKQRPVLRRAGDREGRAKEGVKDTLVAVPGSG